MNNSRFFLFKEFDIQTALDHTVSYIVSCLADIQREFVGRRDEWGGGEKNEEGTSVWKNMGLVKRSAKLNWVIKNWVFRKADFE